MFGIYIAKRALPLVALLLQFQPAYAEEVLETLNPIDCLNALEPLKIGFRSHLQVQCIALPLEVCGSRQNPVQCLTQLNQTLIGYFTELRPNMPDEISGDGFGPRLYSRALVRLDRDFSDFTQCNGLEELEFQICQATILSAATIDLFYRARQAEVVTP